MITLRRKKKGKLDVSLKKFKFFTILETENPNGENNNPHSLIALKSNQKHCRLQITIDRLIVRSFLCVLLSELGTS